MTLADYYTAKYRTAVEVDVAEEAADNSQGVMVAFMLTREQAEELVMVDGEPESELHVTLTYNAPTTDDLGGVDNWIRLLDVVQAWARTCRSQFTAEISGPGVFTAGPEPVTVALVDLPGDFPAARQRLVDMLTASGLPVFQNHGYTPHITLAYADRREEANPTGALVFETVTVMLGSARYDYALGSGEEVFPDLTPVDPVKADVAAYREANGVKTDTGSRAFVTEHADKIMVTAPATVGLASFDGAVKYSQYDQNLYVVGRFVGSNVPNRNGAMWSAEDLARSVVTIPHTPLDWLHIRRFLVGTFIDARYVTPTLDDWETTGQVEPYIEALAVIWGHQYPAVAQVVQEASAAGRLWYSMECVADAVQCTGPFGCGEVFSYADYRMHPELLCSHLQQRTSVRQLINPTFRGGAIIVPPTEPGWADADVQVLQSVRAEAEMAFAQAGSPDDTPVEVFEQVVAQVWAHAEKPDEDAAAA